MTGKRSGPATDRYGPVMEMKVALLRASGISVYCIALALTMRRQSVDLILRRPHVAARVENARTGLRAQGPIARLRPSGPAPRSYSLSGLSSQPRGGTVDPRGHSRLRDV
jgi:hypothetical protein